MNELLPIGSVVLVKGVLKKVMIIGFFPETDFKNPSDYLGIILDKSNPPVLFNHSDINNILFIGYQTHESIAYQKLLKDSKELAQSSNSELEAILEVRKKYLEKKEKLQ